MQKSKLISILSPIERVEYTRSNIMKTIAIGADRGGLELKAPLISRLEKQGYHIISLGVDDDSVSVDYPDVAKLCGEKILSKEADFGILLCGTGLGIGIAANKMKGIRAATCSDTYSARMAREHNDCNILTLGARILGVELAWEITTSFLNAEFGGERHERRVNIIKQMEEDFK